MSRGEVDGLGVVGRGRRVTRAEAKGGRPRLLSHHLQSREHAVPDVFSHYRLWAMGGDGQTNPTRRFGEVSIAWSQRLYSL